MRKILRVRENRSGDSHGMELAMDCGVWYRVTGPIQINKKGKHLMIDVGMSHVW